MPVGELLARTPSHELTEWKAYEAEYGPLGPERGDWNAATVAHTVAVMQAGKKGKRLKITDFLLKWSAPRRQSPLEQLDTLKKLPHRQETRK